MNLTAIPEPCLQMAARSIETLPPGRDLALSCAGRHFVIRREGADFAVSETPAPSIAAASASAKAKPCSGCGAPKAETIAQPVGDVDMLHYFDLVFVLNLPRRADRLAEFRAHLAEIDWPFRQPEVFTGIDAKACPPPPWWSAGAGAWGCMESHRHMLARALSTGAQRILILEDDFFGVPSFSTDAPAFVRMAPYDWEMLYFGGQDIGRDGSRYRKEVTPGVFQVAGIERTHAYAVQGGMIRDLYQKLIISSGHCDHVMGPFQRGRKVYAPAEWLAGQAESKSDIGNENRARLWQPPNPETPIFWSQGTRQQVETLRENGFHFGYHRNADGVDVGLASIAAESSAAVAVARLRNWIEMLSWEARSLSPERNVCIWCPRLPRELVIEAVGARLVEL